MNFSNAAAMSTSTAPSLAPSPTPPLPPLRPRICRKGGRGLFLPAFRESEHTWDDNIRGLLYGVALLYCFLGVSIVSDIFMNSIETMTSKKKRVKLKDSSRAITVYVWNSTVSNLSLMALGSSAPEILLSVIELLGDDMFSGELGPLTVVGSAAFNLLVIVAVCVFAIPVGEVRFILSVKVYSLTAVWSLAAYAWLLVIVEGEQSPGVVDLWEGLVTLACFPVLVFNAYLVDRYEYRQRRKELEKAGEENDYDEEGAEGKEEAEEEEHEKELVNRVHRHRSSGIRMLVAGKSKKGGKDVSSSFGDSDSMLQSAKEPDNTIWFPSQCTLIDIRESMSVPIKIVRTGDVQHHVQAKYETAACTCRPDVDYLPTSGFVTFLPGETEQTIDVQLLQETREVGYFKMCLSEPCMVREQNQTGMGSESSLAAYRNEPRKSGTTTSLPCCALGKHSTAYVLVVNSDFVGRSGVLTFGSDSLEVQGGVNKRKVPVPVFRVAGSENAVMCAYRTERLSAVPGYDYEEDEGEIYFIDGQAVAMINITVLPKRLGESNDCFQIVLDKNEGGVLFNPHDDGGEDSCILTVTIVNENRRTYWRADTATFYIVDKIFNVDFLREVAENWCDQIVCACFCNGSFEAQKTASVGDWTMHLAVLPWKLFYAVSCPPPVASWACFVLSLGHIGLVTAVVCDLAELFGCVLEIEDTITATTFVALGTSLPDLFASRTAAVQDDYADASIVNVTGSNAVNVFLGVGLTWSIGAIYWKANGANDKWRARYGQMGFKEGLFIVRGDNLTFSVIVFMMAAVVCLLVLNARRRAFGGELGGPYGAKVFTATLLVMLWIWYVSLVCWNAQNSRSSSDQAVMILGASALLGGIILISGVGMNLVTALTIKYDNPEGNASPTQSEGQRDTESRLEETERLLKILPKLRQAGSGSKTNVTIAEDGPTSAAQVLQAVHEMRSDLARWANTLEKFENAVRAKVAQDERQQSQIWNCAAGNNFGTELPLQPLRVMASTAANGAGRDAKNKVDPWGDPLEQGELLRLKEESEKAGGTKMEDSDPDKV